jgi:hypothetical protein
MHSRRAQRKTLRTADARELVEDIALYGVRGAANRHKKYVSLLSRSEHFKSDGLGARSPTRKRILLPSGWCGRNFGSWVLAAPSCMSTSRPRHRFRIGSQKSEPGSVLVRAAIYPRRSTNAELQAESLETQEEILRKHAVASGFVIVSVYRRVLPAATPRAAGSFCS